MQYLRKQKDKKETVLYVINEKMIRLFRGFIVVREIPRVVYKFVETHYFYVIQELQKEIVSNYLDDIAKYAVGTGNGIDIHYIFIMFL